MLTNRSHTGVTLVELMVTLAVLAWVQRWPRRAFRR